MKTVQTILGQLTDPKTIMAEIRETLRTIDPEFFDTEVKYLAAASDLEKDLGGSITPSVGEFLAAKEEEFAPKSSILAGRDSSLTWISSMHPSTQ